jgi:hypothetical protein
MTTYLSGKIVPLTPSTRPTNVAHLVRSKDNVDHSGVDVGAEAIEHQEGEVQKQVIHPVAIPDKKSFCVVS